MAQGGGSLIERGQAALADYDWAQARDAFTAALDVEVSGEALMGLSDALWWLGELDDAVASRERAFTVFRDAGDLMQAALAALFTSLDYQKQYGDAPAAAGWLARAARIIEGNGLDELRPWLLFASSFNSDDPVEGERLARDAHRAASAAGDRELELCTLSQIGVCLVAQGRVDEGVRHLDESMAVALGAEGSPEVVVFTSCMMMTSCTRCAEFARAVQWVRRALEFTERCGCPLLYAECRIHYGSVLLATGDWDGAARELDAALALSAKAAPTLHRLAVATLAELWLAQGRLDDVERLIDGLEDHVELAPVIGRLHLLHDRPAAAISVLRRGLTVVEADRLEASRIAEVLGEAEVAAGDIASATERAAMIIEAGAQTGCALVSARGRRLAGRVAMACGDPLRARGELDAALVGFARLELVWEVVRTRLLLAEALEDAEPEVAGAEGRAALAAAERMGAQAAVDEAAALLRRLGVSAGRAGARDGASLSRREEQVLTLIGEGLSNPEIAARLHVSRRTVEHHVAHILVKLGAKNRAEAAVMAAHRAGTPAAS